MADHTAGLEFVETERLLLSRPEVSDVDDVFAILNDPKVWTHLPSRRHTERARTAATVDAWRACWDADGLGPWVARLRGETAVIGYGGCSRLSRDVWNLGYRFSAGSHGRGYATELATEAVARVRRAAPGDAIVAYLLEHNRASARVAEKLGMEIVHRAPDAGNPDPDAVRLVYSFGPLTELQLAAALR